MTSLPAAITGGATVMQHHRGCLALVVDVGGSPAPLLNIAGLPTGSRARRFYDCTAALPRVRADEIAYMVMNLE